MKLLISLLFTFIIVPFGFAQNTDGWKLARNQEGIKIYLRSVKGLETKEVLGLTQVHATLGTLVSMVKDTENHHIWIDEEGRFLKIISDFEWIYYNISKAPWPARDRDIITHVKMEQDADSYAVRIESEGWPDYIPIHKNLVRITKLKSSWVFTPKGKGIIDICFELSIDLGGDIPAWLVNIVIDKGPFNTLLNLAELIKTDMYRSKVLPYIKEKTF